MSQLAPDSELWQSACRSGGSDAPGEQYCTPSEFRRTDIQAMLRRSQQLCGTDPDAFTYDDLVTIQAPMVRCSRPPFRKLCRLWGTKVCYTHMIMSNSFSKSAEARASDFAVYAGEDVLVAQIAGTHVGEMTTTASLLAPYCDAIDINCGCPQKWAMKEGIGSAMLEKPELTAEIVKSITLHSGVPCVVKMRVYEDVRKSVDFARAVEAAGAAWVTVHGRTPWDPPSCDVRVDAVCTIRDALQVPVVVNGSIDSVESAMGLARACRVGGVMSARGLLSNPACFAADAPEFSSAHFNTASLFLPETSSPSCRARRGSGRDMAETPNSLFGGTSGTPSHTPSKDDNGNINAANSGGAAAVIEGGKPLEEQKLPPRLQRRRAPVTPRECVSDFVRLSAVMNLQHKAFLHHVLLMANDLLSPTERSFLSQQKSFPSVISLLREAGIYVNEGRYSVPLHFPSPCIEETT